MDVAVTDFRANLRSWLDRAKDGEEIVVTDHGFPVARVVGIGVQATLERLTDEGIIGRPRSTTRPVATGRALPKASRSIADIVSEQRR